MTRKLLLLLIGTTLLAALAGCDTVVQGAVSVTACQALERLDEPFDELIESVDTATIGDIKDVKAKLDVPVESLRTANQALDVPGITQLLLAYDFFSETIDEQSVNEPLSPESKAKIDEAIERVRAELEEVFTSLDCSE